MITPSFDDVFVVVPQDKKELGEIDLSKYLVRHTIDPKMKKTHGVFELYCPHERAYLLYCENDGESDAWVRAIEEVKSCALIATEKML